MNDTKPILIVDADILLFTISRITEDITEFDDQTCESFDKESSIRLLDSGIEEISKKTGFPVEDIFMAISHDNNFRKRHFPTYKSNRKNVRKPLGLIFLRSHLLEFHDKYNTVMMEELEADDCMGILGTSEGNISIYSQDKDLYTIPVRQWDFKNECFIIPTKEQSCKFLYRQVLTGDSVDGYKGCPKIGKVKADRLLMNCKSELELLKVCHLQYKKVYKENAKCELLEQIGQARILHYLDFQMLRTFDTTYNPYEVFNVTDELIMEWEKEK